MSPSHHRSAYRRIAQGAICPPLRTRHSFNCYAPRMRGTRTTISVLGRADGARRVDPGPQARCPVANRRRRLIRARTAIGRPRAQTLRPRPGSSRPQTFVSNRNRYAVIHSFEFRTRLLSVPQSTTLDARLVDNQERNTMSGRQESTEAAPVKRTLSAKRAKPSAANQPHVQPQPGPTQPRDADVQMADATPTLQEKQKSPPRPPFPTLSHHVKAARKFGSTVSATSTDDDVEMNVDSPTFSEPTSRATSSRASQAPFSDNQPVRSEPVAGASPYVRAASSTNEREREVRQADGAAVQPRVNQDAANEVDDDPDDLYGPPVERRIIRILPSMAEELREQQRRVAAEKVIAHRTRCMTRHTYSVQEKRRAPLAPDWILARHANNPLWKEIPTSEGRKPRKSTARSLRDSGLNVNELVGCFTVQNWVREHKG